MAAEQLADKLLRLVDEKVPEWNFQNTRLGPEGAQSLAASLKRSDTARLLHLTDSGIDTATAAALASALEGNTTLRQLCLQRNTSNQDILDMINGLLCHNQALASSPPAIASSSLPTGMGATPPERNHNRWGDGLNAPAAGTRVFFPNGWVPQRDTAEAIGAFGHDAAKLAYVLARGRQIAADLARVNVTVKAEFAAVLFAYTQEDPVVRLYARCNEACRTAGPAAETRLALYRDYLHHLSQALTGLPNFVGTAYRGVRTLMPPGCYEVGQSVTWHPFTSTTRSATCTVPFLGRNGRQLDGSLFVLHVVVGGDISDFSEYPQEREVLLRLNSMWRVTGRCSSETEKKAVVPELGGYELTHLDVYMLRQW